MGRWRVAEAAGAGEGFPSYVDIADAKVRSKLALASLEGNSSTRVDNFLEIARQAR